MEYRLMGKVELKYGLLLGAAWLAAGLVMPPAAAQKSRIVCWTEENGRRACGDQVPARYAKVEREVFNERGVVVDKFPPEPSPADRASAAQRSKDDAEAQRQRRNQDAYDRYLFESYASLKDLEAMRDSRLGVLDGRMALTAKAIAADEAAQKNLRERTDKLKTAGKEPAAPLANQLRNVEASLAGNRKALAQLKSERQKTEEQFARDIVRYQELRAARSASAQP